MTKAAPITWTNETRRLSQLIPWPRNPREIEEKSGKRLQQSKEEFGQPEPLCIGPDNSLYNGHQRLKTWAAKFGDIEVDVRVSSRLLTEKEREKLTVFLYKGATGKFDFDILANQFEIPDLIAWGFEPFELGIVGAANDPNEEWKGMPEFEQEDLNSFHAIKIHFANEIDMIEFAKLINQTVTVNTKSRWFPEQIIHDGVVQTK